MTATACAAGRTISINFGSGKGSVSGEYGIVPSSSWNNFSDAKQTTAVDVTVSDGTSGVTAMWWSSTVWGWTTATDNALKGYLDDGACGDGTTGAGPHIAILGIPFSYYDVIVYYATDSGSNQFNPAAFKEWTQQSKCGDESDSYDGTMRLSRGNASLKFGKSQNLTAEIGTNVAYLKRCFSFKNLDIKGAPGQNSARGGIAAIQIVECDPHESEMYHNRLGGASITIPADTYGAIAVDTDIKATQYASQTTLPLTGSTAEISGNLQYVEGQATDTRTHTIVGWFRCDGLDGEKLLYGARSHLTSGHGGYKVVVDANGAINIGKCGNWAWQGTALKSADGVIAADTWYHIAVAITSAKPDAHTSTIKVFVNGAAIDFPTTTMATNLDGGSKCIEFSIGGGVSAAGLYADFSAISDAGLVQSLATNATYVAFRGNDYTASVTGERARFSDLAWEPELPSTLTGKEAFIINVEDVSETELTFDTSVSASQVTVTGEADIALTQGDDVTLGIASYDFSAVTGKLTLGVPMAGVTATYPVNPDVFFNYEYTGAPPLENGTLEYSNAALTWANNIAGSWTLKVAEGDNLSIDSTANIRPTFNVDISGGTLTFDPNATKATAWCGQNGATTYTQTGGEVYFKANGQTQSGSDNGVILGYTGTSATPLVLDISGGLFAVENSSINMWNAATINLSGGTVRAKGVFAGASSGAHEVNIGAGAVFELGSLGWRAGSASVTLEGTLRAYENAAMANDITYTDGAKLVAASGTYLFISGTVTGEGTLTCGDTTDNGEVVFMGDAPEGVAGTYYYGYEVTINDCGRMAIPEGKEVSKIRVFDANGKALEITGHDSKYIYFDWEITGGACWWDYEFEGNGDNSGTEGTALSWDGGRPFQGAEYVTDETTGEQSLHIPSRPWRDVGSWPTVATFVMYGTMVEDANSYYVVFGSSTAGTKNTVFLATDDASSDRVVLCSANGLGSASVVTPLCTMTVPNAKTAKHLYAFVLKTVGENSVVDIYLDGELLQDYTFEGTFQLGKGFQIASPHGGVVTGYARPADDDAATLDWLRVYNLELSSEAMAKYAEEYPYVSPKGLAKRTFTGDASWQATKQWEQTTFEGKTSVVDHPNADTIVSISASTASEVTFNLETEAHYEQLNVSGADITLRRGGLRPEVAGLTTVGANLTVDYDAVTFGPVKVLEEQHLTFDFKDLDLSDYWTDTEIVLTGAATLQDGAVIDGINITPVFGRTASVTRNATTGYYVLHIAIEDLLTAEVSGETVFGDLVWKMGEVEVTNPDWGKVGRAKLKLLADSTLTFNGTISDAVTTLVFTNDYAVTLSVGENVSVTGFAYDFSALEKKATFTFAPDDASKVKAGYVRYDVDMGGQDYDKVLASPGGRYEFKKVTIWGNGYDYHDRTVIVQAGDYVHLNDGSTLGCGLSLDVRGGEVHLGKADGHACIAYGRNGTRFKQSGGTVTVHANGATQQGTESGFVLSHSAAGGGCHEFQVTGGLFTVPDSSICFNEATNTIMVSGTGVVRAKGAFSAKEESVGIVNVSGEGALEIGALGFAKGACTLKLNGGTLRGYEAGSTNSCAITLGADSMLASAIGADLTMSGEVTGTGGLTISEGTVKLGAAAAFGEVGVTVSSGATLDLNGNKMENALTISGAGVGGAGALVSHAADEGSYKGALTLADAAAIGGTGTNSLLQGSEIDLAGHVLTIAGRVKMGGFTVTSGGGAVVVGPGGTLQSNGATALGNATDTCDLTIAENGTLALTGGNSVSCWNFASSGAVVGEKAQLIVNGTFDAKASVTVTNLKLGDGATLSGLGLTVTDQIAFGTKLSIVGTDLAKSITVATIPEKDVTLPTSVLVDGVSGYELNRVGKNLVATSGAVILGDLSLTGLVPWVDFTTLRAFGSVTGLEGGSYGKTNIHFVVTAGDGSVTTQTFAFASTDGTFTYELVGLQPGKEHQVYAYLTLEHREVDAKSKTATVFQANNIDGWIDERADTFDLDATKGTGQWQKRSGETRVATSSGTKSIVLTDADVAFYPTNVTPTVVCSPIHDVSIRSAYEIGFTVSLGEHAGIRLATNETGACQFEVMSNDTWCAVSRETFAPAAKTVYEILVRLNASDETASYVVVAKGGNSDLGSFACAPMEDFADFSVRFVGTGAIETLVGVCHNTNLCRVYGVPDEEYSDLDAALEATGGDIVVEPIWPSSYRLHGESGSFYYCTNGLLTIVKDKWYHDSVAPGKANCPGSVHYSYCAGNNWIEYADVAGVEPLDNGGWLVTNEVGLAWIAACATNEWFSGDVALGADLDLSSKNWTPIAQYTGVFDGRGHTIVGLNNTNVIDHMALGEAGRYPRGTENDWGYASYGLFGCATNAAFRNVTFAAVAISNAADSVAALLGVHAGGDLSVVNVTNDSGYVRGEGYVVAGLLAVGGNGETIGNVVVTGNVNRATIVGYISSEEGENAAQILAGTTWGTMFGKVNAAENVAEGDFEVVMDPRFGWLELPACNFAPAVIWTDDNGDFWHFIEANDSTSVVIDSVYRTARMSAGRFSNGTVNTAGSWTDAISEADDGGTVTLEVTGETLDVWGSVAVDRDITFDLNANGIYGVYDSDVFVVSGGKTLTLKNGTVYYAEGYSPTVGNVVLENVKTAELVGDFYQRTVPLSGLDLAGEYVTIAVPHSSASFYYVVDGTSSLGGDWKELLREPGTGGELQLQVPVSGETGFYRVRVISGMEAVD